jgi:hypothetical protein
MNLFIKRLAFAFLLTVGALAPAVSRAQSPCLDVTIEYLGRDFVQNIGGIDYFQWNYKVTGDGCINRGLSHWTLEICQNYWDLISGLSDLSVDNSDAADGDSTWYAGEVGIDPTTGVSGIKWNAAGGNQLDKVGETDTFSFISPGNENYIIVTWAGKSGNQTEFGSTIGPSCDPLPVESATWGAIKSRF